MIKGGRGEDPYGVSHDRGRCSGHSRTAMRQHANGRVWVCNCLINPEKSEEDLTVVIALVNIVLDIAALNVLGLVIGTRTVGGRDIGTPTCWCLLSWIRETLPSRGVGSRSSVRELLEDVRGEERDVVPESVLQLGPQEVRESLSVLRSVRQHHSVRRGREPISELRSRTSL